MPIEKRRRSIRLKDYDYTQPGAYFVTLVTHGRKCLFGEVVGGVVQLNDAGRVMQAAWDELPNNYAGVEHDAFIVMPNHVHGIVVLVGAGRCARPLPANPMGGRGSRPLRTSGGANAGVY